MATVARVVVLLWVDILAIYAMYIMMTYLTDVWDLGFTQAAAIVNIFWGVVTLSPLFLAFLTDLMLGNYLMLLLSSISYSLGLGLLTMSTPPVLANSTGMCPEYKPECIGHVQKVLFYTAMPLIAFGMAGHITSWSSFANEQLDEEEPLDRSTFWRFFYGILAVIIVTFVAVWGLPYIRPWSLRFGIPSICTLIATFLFLSGSCSYKIFNAPGTPLIMFLQVPVAATLKMFHKCPKDANELFEFPNPEYYKAPHTRSLRCLDKAAIILPTISVEEQARNPYRLSSVTEVEETKTFIRMIPVCTTFILCGVVVAIGFTFFIEQLSHLDHKVGRLTVPTPVLLWFFEQSQNLSAKLYAKLSNYLSVSGSAKFAPSLGIAVSMVLGILCCITAARVENRRLAVVRKHGLIDKPDETVPMTMFWLLPQFVLLGGFSGVFNYSSVSFFVDQSPVLTRKYLPFFISAVSGVGILGSVLSVYVVGRVSERGGKRNWFRHDLNGSRVDKYYWTLAWLLAVDLAVFVVVAVFYRYKEAELREESGVELGGVDEGFDDSSKCWCCC